jgi:hypothetical protein
MTGARTWWIGAALTLGVCVAHAQQSNNMMEEAARMATAESQRASLCDDCGVVTDISKRKRSEEGGVRGILGKIGIDDDEVWVTRVKMKDGKTERFQHDDKPDFREGDIVVVDGRRLRKQGRASQH